jgi:predicted nucleotidyltransferase
MKMVKIVENNIPQIIELCKKHKIKSLYLFGSATDTNHFNKKRDVDFLYEYDLENYLDWDKGDFDIATNFFLLRENLEKTLERKVDLIPNKLRNPYFINSVEKSKNLIYARP